jgi:hypothetical protein
MLETNFLFGSQQRSELPQKAPLRALGTPRNVPDSPNVELQTLPSQSAPSSHSGYLWVCHSSRRIVLGGLGINGLLLEQ